MAGILDKLTKDGPAARKLAVEVDAYLRQDFDPDMADDTIARYVSALACKVTDKKKFKASLSGIMGPQGADDFVEW